MVNSNDCLLRESSGHASVAYNSIGKHLERSKLKTNSSEAKRPTLPYTALNALKKRDLAWAKSHLNVRPLTKNTPR